MESIVCPNPECGAEIKYSAEGGVPRRCPFCGEPLEASQPPEIPEDGAAGKRKMLLAGAAAAVVVLLGVLAMVLRSSGRPPAPSAVPEAAAPSPSPTPAPSVSPEPSPTPQPSPTPSASSPPPTPEPSPTPAASPTPKSTPKPTPTPPAKLSPEAEKLLAEAEKHARAGEYSLAVDALKKALEGVKDEKLKKYVQSLIDEYTARGLRAADVAEAERAAREGDYVRAVCLYERAAARLDDPLSAEAMEGFRSALRLMPGSSFAPRPEIEMKGFPAVAFLMGNPKGAWDEKPVHRVKLSPYWLMHTEVTNAMFLEAVKAKALRPPVVADFGETVWTDKGPLENALNHPVTAVSWAKAMRFCLWLTRKHHEEHLLPSFMSYTLPTEAQWEYAACGNEKGKRLLPAGAGLFSRYAVLGKYCAYGVESVKMRLPNPFGLYDMAGNAAEWCLDRYGPYSGEEQTDPAGPAKGKERVIRGGSFLSEPWNCTASARFHLSPYRRASYVGFRMAAVISDAAAYRSLAGLDEKGAEGGKGK